MTAAPPEFSRMAQVTAEVEAATFIRELAHGYPRVLNVGPSWGRDYYALTEAGHTVVNLDVAPQAHLPNLVLANIATTAPFPANSFDVIVIAEVLEHIWNDGAALREARRLLKDQGRIIVTVPFYNDGPDYHVRIHSPRTIRRLLQANGFEVSAYLERGGLITFSLLLAAVRRLATPFGLRARVAETVIRIDRWLGRRRHPLLRWSPFYGCYAACVKSTAVDFEQLNAIDFAH